MKRADNFKQRLSFGILYQFKSNKKDAKNYVIFERKLVCFF